MPQGPYLLQVRSRVTSDPPDAPPLVGQYPVDGARSVRLGADHWARKDTTALTPTTKLALTLGVPEQMKTTDTFSWLGLRSYFVREASYAPVAPGDAPLEGEMNPPAVDATSTSAWTFDAAVLDAPYGETASGLPVAAASDDLRIMHHRKSTVNRGGDRFVPWNLFTRSDAVGVLDVPNPDFKNEITNTVTGTLAAPPTESLSITVKGSTFAAMRQGVYPLNARSRATVTLTHEAGQGPGYFASAAPMSWSFTAQSRPNVMKPQWVLTVPFASPVPRAPMLLVEAGARGADAPTHAGATTAVVTTRRALADAGAAAPAPTLGQVRHRRWGMAIYQPFNQILEQSRRIGSPTSQAGGASPACADALGEPCPSPVAPARSMPTDRAPKRVVDRRATAAVATNTRCGRRSS